VTGKAGVYVKQDFLAQVPVFILMSVKVYGQIPRYGPVFTRKMENVIVLEYNMVQDLTGEAEEKGRERGREREYKYAVKINENIAIRLWKEQFVRLMLEDNDEKKEWMFRRLKEEMARNIVPERQLKGRVRKWNYFNKYKCNQKPGF
jgi:hypothetical protein